MARSRVWREPGLAEEAGVSAWLDARAQGTRSRGRRHPLGPGGWTARPSWAGWLLLGSSVAGRSRLSPNLTWPPSVPVFPSRDDARHAGSGSPADLIWPQLPIEDPPPHTSMLGARVDFRRTVQPMAGSRGHHSHRPVPSQVPPWQLEGVSWFPRGRLWPPPGGSRRPSTSWHGVWTRVFTHSCHEGKPGVSIHCWLRRLQRHWLRNRESSGRLRGSEEQREPSFPTRRTRI